MVDDRPVSTTIWLTGFLNTPSRIIRDTDIAGQLGPFSDIQIIEQPQSVEEADTFGHFWTLQRGIGSKALMSPQHVNALRELLGEDVNLPLVDRKNTFARTKFDQALAKIKGGTIGAARKLIERGLKDEKFSPPALEDIAKTLHSVGRLQVGDAPDLMVGLDKIIERRTKEFRGTPTELHLSPDGQKLLRMVLSVGCRALALRAETPVEHLRAHCHLLRSKKETFGANLFLEPIAYSSKVHTEDQLECIPCFSRSWYVIVKSITQGWFHLGEVDLKHRPDDHIAPYLPPLKCVLAYPLRLVTGKAMGPMGVVSFDSVSTFRQMRWGRRIAGKIEIDTALAPFIEEVTSLVTKIILQFADTKSK